jgi:hypothetical protein
MLKRMKKLKNKNIVSSYWVYSYWLIGGVAILITDVVVYLYKLNPSNWKPRKALKLPKKYKKLK